jgi:hypothetical protein
MMDLPMLNQGELTTRQKNKINHYRTIRKTLTKVSARKQKYYCPTHNEGYYASINHTHCLLCYDKHVLIDKHSIIAFDSTIHEW